MQNHPRSEFLVRLWRRNLLEAGNREPDILAIGLNVETYLRQTLQF
jgi:hypothetical protein